MGDACKGTAAHQVENTFGRIGDWWSLDTQTIDERLIYSTNSKTEYGNPCRSIDKSKEDWRRSAHPFKAR